VSFRISEEEYQDLVNLCAMRQARSLSQFEAKTAPGKPENTLREIYRKLGALDREVKRLAGLLEPPGLDPSLQPAESSHAP
jgi:hypothetical protein